MFNHFSPIFLLILSFVIVSQYGKCNIEPQVLSFGGVPSIREGSPWKTAIFRNDLKKSLGFFINICGGVLISKDVILTGEK